jgi:hypothetical protein
VPTLLKNVLAGTVAGAVALINLFAVGNFGGAKLSGS